MAVYTTINKSEDYFKALLYTGTHASVPTITVGWKSDFLWLKSRTQTYDHNLLDTTRGGTKKIFSNKNDAESSTGDSVTFNATTFEPSGQAINESGQGANNMMCWTWKANGGTTASNASGTITSTTQVNTTAGHGIVTYTGNGVNGATVGHSLGVVPQVIIVKRLDSAANWMVYHEATGHTKATFLDLTAAADTDSGYWSNTAPTTGIFNLGTNTKGNANGGTYVAYCFAEIQGYSKFGSYFGNGGSDGTFIYTGFKPRFFMLKGTGNISSWCMYDTARDPINRASQKFWANENNAEQSTGAMDFLSNGIKMRTSDNDFNGSGNQYLYMAFAENPFVTSDKVPTTAK